MIDSKFGKSVRVITVGLAVTILGACDDSTGSSVSLQPEDVSAVYRVCALTFDPTGTTLPTVDIMAAAFKVDGTSDPTIGLDPNAQRTFELTYVPKGQVNDQELRGTYTLRGSSTVEIRFGSTGVSPTPLLIPENRALDFEYQESPLALTLAASSQYNVTRSAYVTLSGADPAGLAEQIPGVLSARFQVQACAS